jgi:hypothetical protein
MGPTFPFLCKNRHPLLFLTIEILHFAQLTHMIRGIISATPKLFRMHLGGQKHWGMKPAVRDDEVSPRVVFPFLFSRFQVSRKF